MTTQPQTTLPSPYSPRAPWPCMRADVHNSGRSPFLHEPNADAASIPLRRWSTGNGIFSTPIIGADETIYVGSADKSFYAFDPVSGAQRWSYPTGECIDKVISRPNHCDADSAARESQQRRCHCEARLTRVARRVDQHDRVETPSAACRALGAGG